MHPIICRLGPLTIYSYGLMLALGFSVAAFLSIREAKKQGINQEFIFNLIFIILISGIIGARILYVLLNVEFYVKNPREIFMLTHGGLCWFGGLILGVFVCIVYLKRKKQEIYKIFDMIVPYLALAHAIGRVGCFLNGCCFGKESIRFGLYFPVHDAILIPTQAYSSLALLLIYIILRIRHSREHGRGEIFYLYLFLYSLWRFFIEFFRADSQIFIYGLTLFQIISIILFILSVVMLRLTKKPKIN